MATKVKKRRALHVGNPGHRAQRAPSLEELDNGMYANNHNTRVRFPNDRLVGSHAITHAQFMAATGRA